MLRIVAILAPLALLTIGGYALFIWFLTSVMKGGAAYGLFFVAVVAGVASFFNPCAFPLLPAFLAQRVPQESKKKIIWYGIIVAAGLVVFNIILGAAIGIAGAGFGAALQLTSGEAPGIIIRWVRGAVAILLIALGLTHLTGKGLIARIFEKLPALRAGAQGGSKRFFAYGFGYTLLGVGCGGPILAALSVLAVTQGGFTRAFSTFAVYSLTMAMLIITVAWLSGLFQASVAVTLRQQAVLAQRISGAILLLVGISLLLATIFLPLYVQLLFPK